ncbi:MAG: decarboxylating NADP(+)-dependent phosphogluconate dehydrogenase [Oscillospiraceae bacterium]|nr:decarboxylating NADP(+)-dependent phosphogluconate dehydrogenase [Oscillospiraceae bacterium]
MKKADIGLIGLAVMGENLARNLESRGYSVAVYNRSPERTERFLNGHGAGKNIIGCCSLEELTLTLERPRKVLMMVKAGRPVDELIEQLVPLLEPNDILIDGGNSFYTDTQRRAAEMEHRGLLYVGLGVSGGEEGALKGPSLMPGGSPEAWELLRPVFQRICARTEDGFPCCAWMGTDGAGHFVKMVHNGIEYGDMQLIGEAYQLLRDGLGMSSGEMAEVFSSWNESGLESYLIGITADILKHQENGEITVEHILDAAGQKGTGKWTGVTALNMGVPLTLISEAVFSRFLSEQKDRRMLASSLYRRRIVPIEGNREACIEGIRHALSASRLVSYAQGFSLLRTAAASNGWKMDYASVAGIWRGGCIIRSALLDRIRSAFKRDPDLLDLLMDEDLSRTIMEDLPFWRDTVIRAVQAGIPLPGISSALSWFDGFTCADLPANLLQAQRDYFGAHTYERKDAPRGEFFHTQWSRQDRTGKEK